MQINEALADVKQEGADPFADLGKDTPSDSPTEKEPVKVEPEEGDNTPDDVPFHKHPRWIERETELKSLREKDEAREKEIADLRHLQEETAKKLPTDTSIPEWFKELYGENEVAWTKYNEHEKTKEQEIEQRILERQQKASQQQADEAAHWNRWVDGEIKKLQDEGKVFDRNELIKTMLEYRPTNDQNNFDFEAGYKIYEALKGKDDPAKSIARKQLADTASGSRKGESVAKDYLTNNDLRNRSWPSL